MKMEGHSNLTGTKTLEIIITLFRTLTIFRENFQQVAQSRGEPVRPCLLLKM